MLIGLTIFLLILFFVFLFLADYHDSLTLGVMSVISLIACIGIFIFGCFHGFINYPKTERNTSRDYYSC